MSKNLTEIVFLMDRSGSMHAVMEEAVAGFNGFVEEQKAIPGDARLTLVLFDFAVDIPYESIPLPSVPALTYNECFPRGTTALCDAIGLSIRGLEESIAKRPDESKPDKALFIIMTDGEENSSLSYSRDQIAEMIREKSASNWKFLYLGANIDAFAEGESIGIAADSIAQINYAHIRNASAFRGISLAAKRYRKSGHAGENWADEIYKNDRR